MSKGIRVRGICLGEGIPKICVPMTGTTVEELLEEAALLHELRADVAEWRVDYFGEVEDIGNVKAALKALRAALGDIPLLFTFRTASEGGERIIAAGEYTRLNREIAATGEVDLLDVELFTGDDACREMVDAAHRAGMVVVMSSHDFQRTPPRKELVTRMVRMRALGADVPKIAVTPETAADVLTLLAATDEFVRRGDDCPVITMSMKWLGSLSRISGEFFGSALTFGAAKRASAPGQLAVDDLRTVLRILHRPGS